MAGGVGERIASLMADGQTLGEFAEMLGVSAGALGNYVRGDREPSFEFLVQVGRVTGADMNWLVMGEDEGSDGEGGGRTQTTAAYRLDPVILSRVSRMVAAAYKDAGVRLPSEALVREVGAIYNEMLDRVGDPSDTAEMQALLPWAKARLSRRLAEAVAKPGTGKRSA